MKIVKNDQTKSIYVVDKTDTKNVAILDGALI